jgi:hypothetical protein
MVEVCKDQRSAVILKSKYSESDLMNQPRGRQLEYRIIAINKAGEGEPSNTEMVVL